MGRGLLWSGIGLLDRGGLNGKPMQLKFRAPCLDSPLLGRAPSSVFTWPSSFVKIAKVRYSVGQTVHLGLSVTSSYKKT